MRALFTAGAGAAATGVLAPAAGADVPGTRTPRLPSVPEIVLFDEVYRGHRLVGRRRIGAGGEAVEVSVDGRPLHLMRRADGGYLTMIDHYCSYPTPLAAARGAADRLGPAHPAA
ncbi:tyrosinase family oxidase copper chaperone [Streptomyces sp. NPDC058045]|uniref:tyrosinase family oxidase copper chaperone n=1 Tax=Streptomyces sp. NPDC058045 TaxID=3346311 RepID=UPI0036EAC699